MPTQWSRSAAMTSTTIARARGRGASSTRSPTRAPSRSASRHSRPGVVARPRPARSRAHHLRLQQPVGTRATPAAGDPFGATVRFEPTEQAAQPAQLATVQPEAAQQARRRHGPTRERGENALFARARLRARRLRSAPPRRGPLPRSLPARHGLPGQWARAVSKRGGTFRVVPGTGVEPARPCGHQVLNLGASTNSATRAAAGRLGVPPGRVNRVARELP